MRLTLQRVSRASVEVGPEEVARIGGGVLVFVAIEKSDGTAQVARAAAKLAELRIFDDEAGRMNLDASQSGAAFLVVSQFTLAASLEKGRRPSFTAAADPQVAAPLVDELADNLRQQGFDVEQGRFGARMRVSLVNEGPVTFLLDVR